MKLCSELVNHKANVPRESSKNTDSVTKFSNGFQPNIEIAVDKKVKISFDQYHKT
jgi:hypothetical protein